MAIARALLGITIGTLTVGPLVALLVGTSGLWREPLLRFGVWSGLGVIGFITCLTALAAGLITGTWAAHSTSGDRYEVRSGSSFPWHAVATIVALLLTGLGLLVSAYFVGHGTSLPSPSMSPSLVVITALAVWAALVAIHELIHYAAFRLFGGNPRIEFRLHPIPALQVRQGDIPLSRLAMLVATAAPTVLLTGLGMVLVAVGNTMPDVLITVFFVHFGGCASDLAAIAWLLSLPSHVWIVETAEGVRAVLTPCR